MQFVIRLNQPLDANGQNILKEEFNDHFLSS